MLRGPKLLRVYLATMWPEEVPVKSLRMWDEGFNRSVGLEDLGVRGFGFGDTPSSFPRVSHSSRFNGGLRMRIA